MPVDGRTGRERRRDDTAVGIQHAANVQLLHAVGGGAYQHVIAIVENAVDRIDAHHDQAVDHAADYAKTRQRTGAEHVGGAAAAAQRRVATQVGAH